MNGLKGFPEQKIQQFLMYVCLKPMGTVNSVLEMSEGLCFYWNYLLREPNLMIYNFNPYLKISSIKSEISGHKFPFCQRECKKAAISKD